MGTVCFVNEVGWQLEGMLSDCLVLFSARCDPGNVRWRNAAAGEQGQEVFYSSGESNKVCSFGNRAIRSAGIRERQQAESLSRRKQQETPKKSRERISSQASVIMERKRIPRRSV